MKITVASFKGGVGKTTTAIHLAGYLAGKGSTLLVDGDPNRSCLDWAEQGTLPFETVDARNAKNADAYKHLVIDTQARPKQEELKQLAENCDLLVLPTTPDAMSLKATLKMLSSLSKLDRASYKILLTMIPPPPSHDGRDAAKILTANQLPIFKTQIRRYTVYKKAALQGLLVSGVRDRYAAQAWNDYEKFGKEILK
jgi:chromosome partitioning protein